MGPTVTEGRMTKREVQDRAEQLVRKVVGKTFGQKVDRKIIAAAAAKVARAVPSSRRRTHAAAAMSSNSQA